jgi:hypothetical protein
MTRRMLHPMLQRLCALVILGVGLGIAVAAAASPLAGALAARDAAQARLSHLQDLAKTPTASVARYNPDDLATTQVDDAATQIALQSTLDGLAKAAGLNIQSVRPAGAEALGDVGHAMWAEITLSGDLQALTDFLKAMDAERPIVLVRRLDVEHGEGFRPDSFLRIRLEAGRIRRSAPATQETSAS